MKQQILNLKKKLLLIEIGGELSTEFLAIMNEHGMAEILGKLTDITEEQFAEWVECFGIGRWRNYLIESQYIEYLKPTAKESFFSYLESQGVYFSNPLGKKPDGTPILFSQRNGALELLEWQEAEQKVWNKNLIYVFEII